MSVKSPSRSHKVLYRGPIMSVRVKPEYGDEQNLRLAAVSALDNRGGHYVHLWIFDKDDENIGIVPVQSFARADPLEAWRIAKLLELETQLDSATLTSIVEAVQYPGKDGNCDVSKRGLAALAKRHGDAKAASIVTSVPPTLAKDLDNLTAWGAEIYTLGLECAVEAGQLEMTEQLRKLGVRTPTERKRQEAEVKRKVDLLKPVIGLWLKQQGDDHGSDCPCAQTIEDDLRGVFASPMKDDTSLCLLTALYGFYAQRGVSAVSLGSVLMLSIGVGISREQMSKMAEFVVANVETGRPTEQRRTPAKLLEAWEAALRQ